jgi:AraC-like DNA-binding protein
MDVLSEVLRAVKLQGALFFNAEFTAPWTVRAAQSAKYAPYLMPDAKHLIIFHYVLEGHAFVKLSNGERVEVKCGDIVVLPHGNEHLIGNGSVSTPMDSLKLFETSTDNTLKLARIGGGGDPTRLVCGYMACDPQLSEVFLSTLPELIVVHVPCESSGEWLEDSILFSVTQASKMGAGQGLVLSKLSEVLFVETLRRYIVELPPDQTGWLAGVRDPMIGQALAVLHQHPEEEWSIDKLVRRLGTSRSRLAERFRHFLGVSPMAYLTHWRLKLAAELLETTQRSVIEIAAEVGYGSEAAFNRAFKREFGDPPAQFRRKHRVNDPQPIRNRERAMTA